MKSLRRFLLQFPAIFYTLRFFYRRGKYLYNRFYISLNKSKVPLWNRYLLVNPADINKKPKINSDKYLDCGKVLAGSWDKDTVDFKDDYPYYESVKAVVEGKPWVKTRLYREGFKRLRNGQTAFGCNNVESLKNRGEEIKQLFDDIKVQGYRMPVNETFSVSSDEVSVHISRHGEFQFHDGGHRLSMAQLLGLRQIPVQVSYRHTDWNELRQMLILEAKMQGSLYQRVAHPDLDFLPYAHDPSARFDLILPYLPPASGEKLLDIGANWGMMCHLFDGVGYNCVAVENDPTHIEFARKIRDTFQKQFEIYEGSVFDIPLQKYGRFDVVLALNIFHHFLKTKLNFRRMEKFLTELDTEVIVFEPHQENERKVFGLYKDFGEEEFCRFVMDATGLANCRKIGTTEGGRSLYLIN